MDAVTDFEVRERLSHVTEMIGRHEVALAMLKQEQGELEIAVRVMDRFRDRPDYSNILPPEPSGVEARPSGKPANMTVPQMVIEVLEQNALLDGDGPMESKEILAQIRKVWWATATSKDVGPIMWRMAKEGRLIKSGKDYALPQAETPAVSPAGASEPGGLSGPLFSNPIR